MKTVTFGRRIDAPPDVIYALLRDYRSGHPTILPSQHFTDLQVLEGGGGAGTRIRFGIRLGQTVQTVEALVEEPEPGRVLTETDVLRGTVTRFEVRPYGPDENESMVTLSTSFKTHGGISGRLEGYFIGRLLGRVLKDEMDLIERKVDPLPSEDVG